ncbi:MAG TPA: hypothetical protein VH637_07270 [Streptosporangiaceae bacterium]|jgi:hypothetical protein
MNRGTRRRLLIALAVVVVAGLVAGTDGWIVRHFGAHAASDQGPDNYLNAIACPDASTCWAVGQRASTRGGNVASEERHQLIEQETGGRWHQVRPPRAPVADPGLTSITCPAARDCWAAGGSSTHGSAIIEHWAGRDWELVSSPRIHGAQLESVACAAPDLCWAAGGMQNRRNVTRNILEEWNGATWRSITAVPGGLQPVLFSCPVSGHCLLVGLRAGRAAAARYDRGRWSTAAPPSGLSPGRVPAQLACSAVSACLALTPVPGGARRGAMRTQVWNGRSWTTATAAAAATPPYPAGLACAGRAGCWLLGASGSLAPVAARWQDGRWVSAAASSGPATGYLGDLACAARCWAVGGQSVRLGDGSFYSHPLISPVMP